MTIDQRERLGLGTAKKDQHKVYPPHMRWWRAVTALVNALQGAMPVLPEPKSQAVPHGVW